MRGKNKYPVFLRTCVITAALLAAALFPYCAGEPAEVLPPPPAAEYEHEKENDPVPAAALVVPSPQETVYSGEPQPLSFYYAGEGKPGIVYYPCPEAREEDSGGSADAPVNAGDYYARVIRPVESGFTSREEIFADYRILKRGVKITAEEFQEAFYNGDPKRVRAEAEPALPLSYSYYPNRELMDTAVNTAREALPEEAGLNQRRNFKGYRRVERAPIEQGTYYVWINFPGDENHESADAFVEFTIRPPRGS